MSDEDDYMSDKFLSSMTDVRPSLIHNRAKKRQLDVASKQTEHNKKQKQEQLNRKGIVNNEQLQAALDKPLEEDNKGFKLLAKMGYKPGQALGRESSARQFGEGEQSQLRTEPIKINIKSDRGGLGRDAALRELAEKRRQLRQQHLKRQLKVEDVSAEDFRRRAMQKAEERFMAGELKRCQMSCESLDLNSGVSEPEVVWFWPERPTEAESPEDDSESTGNKNESDEEADADEYTVTEKVELLSIYLRTSYNFCCWCGVHYENSEDLEQNCPGRTKDDH